MLINLLAQYTPKVRNSIIVGIFQSLGIPTSAEYIKAPQVSKVSTPYLKRRSAVP